MLAAVLFAAAYLLSCLGVVLLIWQEARRDGGDTLRYWRERPGEFVFVHLQIVLWGPISLVYLLWRD